MKPFKSLNMELLTEAERDTLSEYVLANLDKLIGFGVVNGKLSELNYYNGKFGIPEALDRLRASCTQPLNISVLHSPPKARILRHRDTNTVDRQCSIIVPLYPKTGYAPTFFWDDLTSMKPLAVLTRQQAPAIVNLQTLHSVSNFNTHRFNFQISFSTPYEEVCRMFDAGELFRPVPA